jgi:hypothetical protein
MKGLQAAITESREQGQFSFPGRYNPEQGKFAERSRRTEEETYLYGIASGPPYDDHGERMTVNCIKSFMDQAYNGDILLYPESRIRGRMTSDMTKAEILPKEKAR